MSQGLKLLIRPIIKMNLEKQLTTPINRLQFHKRGKNNRRKQQVVLIDHRAKNYTKVLFFDL